MKTNNINKKLAFFSNYIIFIIKVQKRYLSMKKMMTTIVTVFAVASFLMAAEKIDTISSTTVVTQQNTNKSLAKQTKIKPRAQTNWSRIKDLFM
jgi:hypothetical protein